MLGDSSIIPTSGGNKVLKSQNTLTHTKSWRIDQKKFSSRSMRRSVRSGSIKLKQTYEHLMENGDIGVTSSRVTSSRARPHELDIKLLQAKRQQVSSYPKLNINQILILYLYTGRNAEKSKRGGLERKSPFLRHSVVRSATRKSLPENLSEARPRPI